jgi:hypothetical protein
MYDLYGITIYEGSEEAVDALRKSHYFQPVFAKLTLLESEGIELPNHFRFLSQFHRGIDVIHPVTTWGDTDWSKQLVVGNTYIVSLFDRYHQQLMMPAINTIHFDCTNKKVFWPLHYKQMPYATERVYDNEGRVVFARYGDQILYDC